MLFIREMYKIHKTDPMAAGGGVLCSLAPQYLLLLCHYIITAVRAKAKTTSQQNYVNSFNDSTFGFKYDDALRSQFLFISITK